MERRIQISGRSDLKSSGFRAVVEADLYDLRFDLGTDRLIFRDHSAVSQGSLAPEPIECRAGIVIGFTEASERTAMRRQKLQLPTKRRQLQHQLPEPSPLSLLRHCSALDPLVFRHCLPIVKE